MPSIPLCSAVDKQASVAVPPHPVNNSIRNNEAYLHALFAYEDAALALATSPYNLERTDYAQWKALEDAHSAAFDALIATTDACVAVEVAVRLSRHPAPVSCSGVEEPAASHAQQVLQDWKTARLLLTAPALAFAVTVLVTLAYAAYVRYGG